MPFSPKGNTLVGVVWQQSYSSSMTIKSLTWMGSNKLKPHTCDSQQIADKMNMDTTSRKYKWISVLANHSLVKWNGERWFYILNLFISILFTQNRYKYFWPNRKIFLLTRVYVHSTYYRAEQWRLDYKEQFSGWLMVFNVLISPIYQRKITQKWKYQWHSETQTSRQVCLCI